ncbi:branched-chain amino acid transport system II carrier protein [Corynebacterium incognita]|uniref:Branched-chain amino acid transport system II carrier protein n=1 Tax=Corynebacterium incognita TaxID=2754725 RepID=A0A7G7CQX7_9CORY|nr:branched-chain amino acid transport system II carrier protein [Corynebacterium incognita]QNE89993.1 branched-chain amino acid transport system II carrier protein [Corynebacterium incognita]
MTATPQGASTSSPSNATGRGGLDTKAIIITSLMVFSMFFGAGNLIFPPEVGVGAGTNFWPGIVGFLIAGVALPVIAIIAVAISGFGVRDLANRGGALFGVVFSALVYLSIGVFYALPRTGAVSMEIAITPLTGLDSTLASFIFNLLFFGVSLALCWAPNAIPDTLGKFLTPALVALLAILITLTMFRFERVPAAPAEDYAESPAVTGLLNGYLTMDALAGLAFGIVIISSLRSKGFKPGPTLVRSTIITGTIAGVLLAAIYLGLALIGQTIPDAGRFDGGAALLAEAAHRALGTPGQLALAAIVILACLTTAVGLISATSEFFHELVPAVSYHAWATIFAVGSIAMATQGLSQVLAIAAPVISFLYPPAITLMILSIIEPLFRRQFSFHWTYRVAIWVAVVWSAISVTVSLGAEALAPVVAWAPGQSNDVGWALPTIAAALVGLALDFATRNSRPLELSAAAQAARREHDNADAHEEVNATVRR